MTCCIAPIDLCIGQGNDKSFVFTVRDEAGALVNISTAAQITFVVANDVESPAILTKTLSGGGVVINNPNQFTVAISDSESAALTADVLYCEVGLVASGGEKYTLGKGRFRVQDTMIWDA